MKKPVRGLARWEGKALRGFFTISKADKVKQPVAEKAKRTRAPSAPAPGLHPPGMDGPLPQRQGRAMETRPQTERRQLRESLMNRVRGLIRGPGSLMNVDWERFKLTEALWKRSEREKAAKPATRSQTRGNQASGKQTPATPTPAKPTATPKAKTRVRSAPKFSKARDPVVTPEKAFAQQKAAAQEAKNAPKPAAIEKGRLKATTEHLFKPSAASEKAAQARREQAREKDQGRER